MAMLEGERVKRGMTVSEAAEALGVTRQAILKAVGAGHLEAESVETLGQQRPMWLIQPDALEVYKRTRHRAREHGKN